MSPTIHEPKKDEQANIHFRCPLDYREIPYGRCSSDVLKKQTRHGVVVDTYRGTLIPQRDH
jgi:hypothetical protein